MIGEKLEGRCLCGAVVFAVTLPVKWCAHCHCSMCRRAHGAPYVTWVGVEAARFAFMAGEDRVRRYGSSAQATRSGCAVCGTPLFFESTRWAGEIHIARAAFPDAAPLVPQAHAFYDDRAPWVALGDELPRLGGTSGTEPKKPA